jgi:hypothetical protein
LFSRSRPRSFRHLVLALLALLASFAILASCAPFTSSIGGDGDGDGGGPSAEAGNSDAAPDGDANRPAPDAFAGDGGFVRQDGGFCGAFSDAIECFDFDESNPPMGFTVSEGAGGTTAFGSTFVGGSPPKAFVVTAPSPGAHAVATLPPIAFPDHTNKTIAIDFKFSVAAAATGAQYLGRLNFTNQSSPIGLSSGNQFQCGAAAAQNLDPGVHAIAIRVPVDANGIVTQFTCSLDASTAAGASVVASKLLTFELGNANSGGGSLEVT